MSDARNTPPPGDNIPPPDSPDGPLTPMVQVQHPAPPARAVAETASTAVAVQAKAAVEARYLMAMKNPRSWDVVRVRLLEACKRPGFASSARYSKPVGGKSIVGPSIRFAEEAMRAMGNLLVETMVVFDEHQRRIVRITTTDLESNLSYPTDILIDKTVERSSVRQGQVIVGQRLNSQGKAVYIVEATEDDLLVKQAALTSKTIRTSALRLLPSDILEDAMGEVATTLTTADAKDPTAARKRICDSFYELGVDPSDLEEYLGHKLDHTTPAELTLLRTVYQALRDGETTWPDVMETKGKNGGFKKADRGTEALASKLGESAKETGSAPASVAPASPAAAPPVKAAKEAKEAKRQTQPAGHSPEDDGSY